jgi:hypothetical protein
MCSCVTASRPTAAIIGGWAMPTRRKSRNALNYSLFSVDALIGCKNTLTSSLVCHRPHWTCKRVIYNDIPQFTPDVGMSLYPHVLGQPLHRVRFKRWHLPACRHTRERADTQGQHRLSGAPTGTVEWTITLRIERLRMPGRQFFSVFMLANAGSPTFPGYGHNVCESTGTHRMARPVQTTLGRVGR